MNEYAPSLIKALTSEARSRISEFSQQNLSNLAYACGRLGHLDGPLLATIADRAVAQMQVGDLLPPSLHCVCMPDGSPLMSAADETHGSNSNRYSGGQD